jgi:hypothetical protein
MTTLEIYILIGAFFGYFNGLMFVRDYKSKHAELRPPYISFQHRGIAAVKLGLIFSISAIITTFIWPGYVLLDLILYPILKKKGVLK